MEKLQLRNGHQAQWRWHKLAGAFRIEGFAAAAAAVGADHGTRGWYCCSIGPVGRLHFGRIRLLFRTTLTHHLLPLRWATAYVDARFVF